VAIFFKMSKLRLPKFEKGQDAKKWLRTFELSVESKMVKWQALATQDQPTEAQKAAAVAKQAYIEMRFAMEGEMATWIDGIDHTTLTDWKQLMTRFNEKIYGGDYARLEKQRGLMLRMEDFDTISQYIDGKTSVLRKCGCSDADILVSLMGGLDSLANAAIMKIQEDQRNTIALLSTLLKNHEAETLYLEERLRKKAETINVVDKEKG